MKKSLFLIILFLLVSGCSNSKPVSVDETKKEKVKMNICWMLPEGVSEAIKPQFLTDLAENGIDADIKITYGGRGLNMNEMINCQVVFTDELISAVMIKDNDNWRMTGRSADLRIGVVTPLNSKINSFSDLKGKVIGGNSGAVRILDNRSVKSGLDFKSSFSFTSLDNEVIRDLILNSDGKNWGKYDAMIVADNLLAYLQVKNLAKLIDQDIIVLPIVVRNDYIQNNPEVMVDFFKALTNSLNSFRKNMISEKKFVIQGMPEDIAPSVYKLTYGQEDNFDEQGIKPLRFYFNKAEIDSLQEVSDIVFDFPFAKPRINIIDYIDLSYMEKAMEKKK